MSADQPHPSNVGAVIQRQPFELTTAPSSYTVAKAQSAMEPTGPHRVAPSDAGKEAKAGIATAPPVAFQSTKGHPLSVSRIASSVSLFGADNGDDVSIASLAMPYREKLRSIKLELNRHKGIIACTSVAAFVFATYFLVAATCMLVIHSCSSHAETSVAVKMGFNPINIAVTLMAMGVGCATLSMSLAYSIEDINWA